MFRATLKSLLARKLRLTLSAFAVVLGVMFVAGSIVMTSSLAKSFDALFAGINSSIDVQVQAKSKLDNNGGSDTATATIPASLVPKIEAAPGVAKATAGVFVEGARVIGKDGKVTAAQAPRFGSSWGGEDDLIQLREGRGPTAPDEVAVDAALAKSLDFKVGDTIGILTLQPKKEFKLVGIFGYSGDRDTLGGSQVVAFTLPVAQDLMLGERNAFTDVQLQADPGVSQKELKKTIEGVVGGGYNVQTRDEVNEQTSKDIREGFKFINYFFLGFAGVALFVGIFLILNTFSMLVAQRTRELALFRAMGAARGQVIRSVMFEALVIGLLGSALGLIAGIGIGWLLGKGFDALLGAELDLILTVPITAIIASFVVGVGITLIAALFPAIRASRIPPIAAMRDAATPDKPLTKVTSIGGAIFVLGGAIMAFGLISDADGALWGLLVGVLLVFIGITLLTPIISRPIVSVLGRIFAWSTPGQLGRRNSARNPRRTAITAGALMVSIALVTGVSTIAASASKSIASQVSETLQAELIISGQQTSAQPPVFDVATLDKIEQADGVEEVAGFYYGPARINNEDSFLIAMSDPAATQRLIGLKAKSGEIDQVGANQIIVDEDTAKDENLQVGDSVPVQQIRGDQENYEIVGIYEQNDATGGFMAGEDAAQNFQIAQPSQAFVKVEDGASVKDVEAEIKTLLADSPEVNVQDQSAFIDDITGIFDMILWIVQILLALAILIAVLGIINTLALSVVERTRELGLLRAIGLRRSQTTRMITVESIVISVFGALLGIVVGVGLGAAVVQALKSQGLTHFALPWGWMGTYLIFSVLVGVIAALLPALRAARLNVLAAISYE
ncbi:ABC transporter permease [Cryptosporangium aurantiacum]|uniref:Putative ABC transport system permease protein n=1 Tax=Cryptosporangium aurantiacum TaxID=134849 RepID=A0A1M7RID0_9ACTN|nr:FtsX-like permease family protein [Cryptosporangium aurantiacum]SHN45912.1 putative ABC transport system permease protein [Cryptosporangium aurantiacum]